MTIQSNVGCMLKTCSIHNRNVVNQARRLVQACGSRPGCLDCMLRTQYDIESSLLSSSQQNYAAM
jgi:hypothetical protein